MPLYDVTKPRVSLVRPDNAENYVVLQKLKSELNPITFDRMVRTVDEAIDSCQPSATTRLVWTRASALFGYGTVRPHKHIEHLWKNIESIVGPEVLALKAVGGLLRWRISLRPEKWLVYRRDSEQRDELGKLITISEYWINENFQKLQGRSIDDLASKWGARIT